MFVSEQQIFTGSSDLWLFSIEVKTNRNFCILDGPTWLEDIRSELKREGIQPRQIHAIWEPRAKSDERWKTLKILLRTMPLELSKCKSARPLTFKQFPSPQSGKENHNESLQEWTKNVREFFTATMLTVLSGGLVWLASNSF